MHAKLAKFNHEKQALDNKCYLRAVSEKNVLHFFYASNFACINKVASTERELDLADSLQSFGGQP